MDIAPVSATLSNDQGYGELETLSTSSKLIDHHNHQQRLERHEVDSQPDERRLITISSASVPSKSRCQCACKCGQVQLIATGSGQDNSEQFKPQPLTCSQPSAPQQQSSLTRDGASPDGVMEISKPGDNGSVCTDEDNGSCDLLMYHDSEVHLDTSGYTSNNSSKDESHSCSCSVSMRSATSSPESILSSPNETLLPVQEYSFNGLQSYTENNGVQREQQQNLLDLETELQPSLLRLKVEDETPIEREIRLTVQREEELRARREMGVSVGMSTRTSSKSANDIESEFAKRKVLSNKKPSKSSIGSALTGTFPSHEQPPSDNLQVYVDTQRKLATTRLQQEIEEQKRREMDLRRDGRVLSISEEHADHILDAPNTKQLDENFAGNEVPHLSLKGTIQQQRALFEPVKLVSPTAALVKNTPSTLNLCDSSPTTEKQILGVPGGSTGGTLPKQKAPQHLKSLPGAGSIQRLISSHGNKGGGNRPASMYSGASNEASNVMMSDTYVDYSAVRLPVRTAVSAAADTAETGAGTLKKVYRSAEMKISEELKEMEKREEELRRMRVELGLVVGPDDQPVEHVVQPSMTSPNGTQSVNSTANAQSLCQECGEKVASVPLRRRTTLVAQWEERIQQEA